MPASRAETIGRSVVVSVALGLMIWRFAFVVAGVDPDSDAYGHHAIARQILVHPRDLTVHWVWLPLWHYLQAGAILLGATLQTIRLFNAVLGAAIPILLYEIMRPRHRDPAPVIAAVVAALSPIGMQMATTGQTEPLFAVLILTVVLALEKEEIALATVAMTLAVILRYESWAVPPALVVYFLIDRGKPKKRWAVIVLPAVAVLAWAAIRKPVDGGWFVFLRATREFANAATGSKGSYRLDDLLYYAVHVPWRVVGYPLVLVPFGIIHTIRRDGLRFCAVFGSILAIITLSWMQRSSLGLERHFVVIVPFYAALIANGIVAIGDVVDRLARRSVEASIHTFGVSGALRIAAIAGLSVAVVGNTWSILGIWMRDWTNASFGAWPDRREIANRIRDLDGTIFCDEPTVELLSGVDRRRFDRRMLDDPRARRWIADARAEGNVYVATWAVKMLRLDLKGRILARSPGTSGDAGFVLLRVDAN